MALLLVLFCAILPASAGADQLGAIDTVSEPRTEITNLFSGPGSLSWTYRDGATRGAAVLGRSEQPSHAGMLPTPYGAIVAFRRGHRLFVDFDSGVVRVARGRGDINHAQLVVGAEAGYDVVWQEDGRRVYAAQLDRDRFGRPELLGRGRIRDVAATQIEAGAGLAVAWQDGRRVRIAIRPTIDSRFGRAHTISNGPAPQARLHADYSVASHTLRVAWTSERNRVQVASRAERDAAFAPPVTLDHTPPRGLALTGDVVAWATRRAVKVVELVDGAAADPVAHAVNGARVDDVEAGGAVGYTAGRDAFLALDPDSRVTLGRGRAVRFDDHGRVAWIAAGRDGEVVKRAGVSRAGCPAAARSRPPGSAPSRAGC